MWLNLQWRGLLVDFGRDTPILTYRNIQTALRYGPESQNWTIDKGSNEIERMDFESKHHGFLGAKFKTII